MQINLRMSIFFRTFARQMRAEATANKSRYYIWES